MNNYVALWRGINVGRAKRLAMADLRSLLVSLGYSNPRSLLNSGNIVFGSSRADCRWHARRIESAVLSELKVDAAVFVKAAAEWEAAIGENTLAKADRDPSRLLVVFPRESSGLAPMAELMAVDWSPEEVALGSQAAYLWCANGILESRLIKALSRLPGEAGTTRNWATVQKLGVLLHEPAT